MEEKHATALEFLHKIVEPVARGDTEALETVAKPPSLDDLHRNLSVLDGEQELVSRTFEKISEDKNLDKDEMFALEAIIIPDQRPGIIRTHGKIGEAIARPRGRANVHADQLSVGQLKRIVGGR